MIVQQTFIIPGSEGRPILADLTYDNSYQDAPLVIFAHGFKGFKDWGTHNLVAEYFAQKGFRYFKFNFSHNGTTPENPIDFADLGLFSDNTFTKEFFDLDQVISFACSGREFKPANKVSLIGHSRGGGVCIIQAAKDPRVSKLITWASIADFSGLWKREQLAEWREKGVIYTYNTRTKQNTPLKVNLLYDLEKHHKEYNILDAAARIEIPWLIIHGDEDENVLLTEAQQLQDQNKNARFMIIPYANHVFGASHPYSKEEMPLQLQLVCEKSTEFLTDAE
ncbi:prolyl oligopeptidase family serine peptidase [Flavihumibacter sp. R14]|nr:prolyl oligopeptidase family serine peptidase [Flavihumibacter soli]